MSYKPYKFGKALWYAFLIWIIGFVWGTTVFMMPSLKNLSSIPYISKYPAISVPLLIVYAILIFFLAKWYLKDAEEKIAEGLKFGITLFLVNIVLDALVYVVLFKGGDYFAFFSIWFAYAMFIVIPWLTGRWSQ
jgi:hypothetical protein